MVPPFEGGQPSQDVTSPALKGLDASRAHCFGSGGYATTVTLRAQCQLGARFHPFHASSWPDRIFGSATAERNGSRTRGVALSNALCACSIPLQWITWHRRLQDGVATACSILE